MNSKHQKILNAIFSNPINGNIEWKDIEALLRSLKCQVVEGKGSGVMFEKNGIRVRFHRPHPQKAALRYRVEDARKFLKAIGAYDEHNDL